MPRPCGLQSLQSLQSSFCRSVCPLHACLLASVPPLLRHFRALLSSTRFPPLVPSASPTSSVFPTAADVAVLFLTPQGCRPACPASRARATLHRRRQRHEVCRTSGWRRQGGVSTALGAAWALLGCALGPIWALSGCCLETDWRMLAQDWLSACLCFLRCAMTYAVHGLLRHPSHVLCCRTAAAVAPC